MKVDIKFDIVRQVFAENMQSHAHGFRVPDQKCGSEQTEYECKLHAIILNVVERLQPSVSN